MAVITIAVFSMGFSHADSLVFAEEYISWQSDYRVGILNSDILSEIPVTVTTFSKDSLKLEWEKPNILTNEILIGYEIQRKSLDSNFQIIVENTNFKNTVYVDRNLNEGYYAYQVIPILEKEKPDEITMHGIDRKSNIFSSYLQGQELLAKNILEQNCKNCFDPEFEEIDNTFRYEFSGYDKRLKSEFQEKITFEVTKATEFFSNIFEVKSNH